MSFSFQELFKVGWYFFHLKVQVSSATHRGRSFGACVRWAWYAEGLLRLRLIRSLLALHALVQRSVQIRPRFAHWQGTLFYRGWAHVRCGSADGARLAGSLDTLRSVASPWARLALPFHGQLLSRATLVPAFLSRHGFRRSGGFPQTAQQTGETALVRLIETVAAASTEAGQVVVVFPRGASFLAVGGATSAWAYRDAWTSRDHRAGTAFQLARFTLVASHWTGQALLRFFVVVRSHGARHWNRKERETIRCRSSHE